MTNEQIAWKIIGSNLGEVVDGVPDFLNDHNAAMMVVEKMREDGYYPKSWTKSSDWVYAFFSSAFECEGLSQNESLCYTICEAALKAKGK